MRIAPYALTCVIVLLADPALAQARDGPVVLHDTGQTKPMAPFTTRVKPTLEPPPRVSNTIAPHGFRLPIASDRLSPGVVEPRPWLKINDTLPRAALRPLFLFGTDPRSLAWVRENRERLKTLRAVGMLIEARTDQDVIAAREAVGDLPLFGASANEIAQALKLQHYPVLITPQGISQ